MAERRRYADRMYGQTFVNSVTNLALVVLSSEVGKVVPISTGALELDLLGDRIVVVQPFSHRLL